jgi:hypothetical protein
VVVRLEAQGFVRREPDPADGRAAFAALTRSGLEALRRAQVVHHATVRELYLGRLTKHELERLAAIFEKALPGVVSASIWPPPQTSAQPPVKSFSSAASSEPGQSKAEWASVPE